jgi:cobyrinic acid a,c-diamide synthase
MPTLPRLLLAAPMSGSGKTTLTAGLIAALAARGLTVAPFKCGPDYIDPSYHALAARRLCHNLDAWLVPPEQIAGILERRSVGADLALIEGVMGLFDGYAGDDDAGSSAQIARLTSTPVVIVLDVRAMARTAAALVAGLRDFDPRIRVAGVILNRVGSPRHAQMVTQALEEHTGLPVLGSLQRDETIVLPERHLGLIPTAEPGRWQTWLGEVRTRVEAGVDLDRLLALARTAPPLSQGSGIRDQGSGVFAGVGFLPEPSPQTPLPERERGFGQHQGAEFAAAPPAPREGEGGWGDEGTSALGRDPGKTLHLRGSGVGDRGSGSDFCPLAPDSWPLPPVIAVARDAAFSFLYEENLDLLRAAGAEIVFFSPLADSALPAGTAGIYLCGGFPELYATRLSANRPLHTAIQAAAARGMPIYAECGGLMYCTELLIDAEGIRHPMLGLLPGQSVMTPRLTLGYRTVRAQADSWLWQSGETVRGHEFHYSVWEGRPTDLPPLYTCLPDAFRPDKRPEGAHWKQILASYVHIHWLAYPALAGRFVAAAKAFRQRQFPDWREA